MQGLFTSMATFGIWSSQCDLVFKLLTVWFCCSVQTPRYEDISLLSKLTDKGLTKQDPFGFLVDAPPSLPQNAKDSLSTMPALDIS